MKFKKGWVFSQVPIWVTCDATLSDGAHRAYCYLAWRQGHDDWCWPSVERMAADLHVSRTTARRHLRELESVGYVKTKPRVGRSSLYTVVADPRGASEQYTPDSCAYHLSVEGGTDQPSAEATGVPGKNDVPPRSDVTPSPVKSDGPPPSGMSGTPVRGDDHDDRKGRESEYRENEERGLEFWSSVLRELKGCITRSAFEEWFAESVGRLKGNTVVVGLEDKRTVDWVSHRLHQTLLRTVRRVLDDHDLEVVYDVFTERPY